MPSLSEKILGSEAKRGVLLFWRVGPHRPVRGGKSVLMCDKYVHRDQAREDTSSHFYVPRNLFIGRMSGR